LDGDGHSDLLAGAPAAGSWLVTRSQVDRAFPRNNQQSFSKPAEWLNSWGQGTSQSFTIGDFNGDAMNDLASWDSASGEIQIALSDSTKFIPQQQPWGSFKLTEQVKMFTGDFNGDGKDDLLFWNQEQNKVVVTISNGKKFVSPATWLENWLQDSKLPVPLVGDFNGDGKKDLAFIEKATGNVDAALSNGSKFVLPKDDQGKDWIKGFATGDNWQIVAGDFSGVGIDCLAAYDRANGRWQFALPDGNNFIVKNSYVTFGKDPEGKVLIGDFNGDHKLDLAVQHYFTGKQAPLDIFLSVLTGRKQ